MLTGGPLAATSSALIVPAVPSALAALAPMKAMNSSRYTGPLCRGKGGLVLAFEREVVMMLVLCEVQIRRLSGHNIVKVDDVQHLLSVSLVQTYLYNGDHAVFLNRRPMSGQGKHGASHCEECERGLQDEACRFCSFGCKVRHLSRSIHAARFFLHCKVWWLGLARFQVFNSTIML